uniref:UBX domain-containing protein 4 n=1 Tax=Esox lucius TaxID=8010 RepID=A0A6Q2Z5G1_ESOLU
MIWFEGSIPAAIISAKQQSSIFVVVITGDDEVSAQMMSSWEDGRVAEASHSCCVAIKVDAKSETCTQFSQIYPVVCIPSSFFIGENGIPLEVVAGGISAEELMKRIYKVKQVRAVTSLTESLSFYRLTKKLEERREQKKKIEEECEIKKEMERRKMGKEMLDFKRKNEDEKTKRIMEERNKEKAEEKAARERVKAQIALDRADRAARYANNQEEVEAARLAALQARQAEVKKESSPRERSAIARIQFRLPDGSSFTNQFPSEARLQDARQFAVNEVGNRYGNFSLATMFPRREFTADDMDKTLRELELAPSASIVLLPQTGRPSNTVVQSSSGGGIWAVLGTILYPLLAVWRFLSGFLFSSPPSTGAAGPRGLAQRPDTASASSSGEPKRETLRKRTLEKQPADFKRDGKIHRLRNHEDSEDENNTWNGNSTQQM